MSETKDWGVELEAASALWRRDNDSSAKAHAELTSGNHSDGYVNCAKIVVDPALLERVASAMITEIKNKLLPQTPAEPTEPQHPETQNARNA